MLFDNDPAIKGMLSNAEFIQCGSDKFAIDSVTEVGGWIHVMVNNDAIRLAFPAKLVIN